jgi:hypothetical protein
MSLSIKRLARRPVDQLVAALMQRGFGPAAPRELDVYEKRAPDPQLAVDIFRGAWSSHFPAAFGIDAGSVGLFEDIRIQRLIELAGGIEGMRVLELGPLEGGHSYMLEKAGARSVLAIEACVLSYLKCLIVKELDGLQRVSFRYGNFMPFLDSITDRFDLIVASGVLYHQREPLRLVQAIAERTDCVFMWTHYYEPGHDAEFIKSDYFTRVPGIRQGGFTCDLFRLDYDSYLRRFAYRGRAGIDDHNHWMQRSDLLACLRHFGLTDIQIAIEETVHPFGPNLTFLARRPAPRA